MSSQPTFEEALGDASIAIDELLQYEDELTPTFAALLKAVQIELQKVAEIEVLFTFEADT